MIMKKRVRFRRTYGPTNVTLLESYRTLNLCKSRNPKSTRRGSSRILTRFGSNCLLCRAGMALAGALHSTHCAISRRLLVVKTHLLESAPPKPPEDEL